jgi:hypothetical protein
MEMELGIREGIIASDVILGTSDPSLPNLRLALKAEVQRPMAVDPPSLLFYDLRRGDILEADIRIVRRFKFGHTQPAAPKVVSVIEAVRSEHVDTSIRENPSATPDMRLLFDRYRVTIDTAALDAGEVLDIPVALRVTGDAESGEGPIEVPMYIKFRHHSHLLGPTYLVAASGVGRRELVIPLWSRDQTPFCIDHVSCSVPGGEVQAFAAEPSDRHEIVLKLVDKQQSTDADDTADQIQIFTDKWPEEPFRVTVVVPPAR